MSNAASAVKTELLRVVNFKKTPQGTLRMHIVGPAAGAGRPAIIIFFCGGWRGFDAQQYFAQSAYFASRGALCFNAEIRSMEVHKTTPWECVLDAKSAIRWVRAHAAEYGIDASRIVAMGGSASGHVSICCAFADAVNDAADDLSIPARPDAMLLFGPALAVERTDEFMQKFGGIEKARALSPARLVRGGGPPTLIMQGDADTVTPLAGAQAFAAAMNAAGNSCTLRVYAKGQHGFHNYCKGLNPFFTQTVRDIDQFLAALGMFEGEAKIDEFVYQPPVAG